MTLKSKHQSALIRPSLKGSSLLVVLAHPDDEFAIFPWLAKVTRQVEKVHVAWLTDGGWGGQDIKVRQQESRRVLESLGVGRSNMHFLGAELEIADGHLHERVGLAAESLLGLGRQVQATELMVPAWEGGHQDHDAAHISGLIAAENLHVPAWEYTLYNGFDLRGPFFRVLSYIPRVGNVQILKTTLSQRLSFIWKCLYYRSQWKSFLGLLPLYIFALRRADAFQRRNADSEMAAKRPHEGALLYERRTGLSWEKFNQILTESRVRPSTK